MSALPRAVQQQLDEADRILQQAPTPSAQPTEPQPAPAEPPVEPQPAAVTPVEPQPAPQPAEPPQDGAYWKARFDTMAGKYNAEVPRMQAALDQTQARLHELAGRVEASRQAPPAAPQPASLVSEKDDEKFGSDLVDLMRRVAREERRPVEHALGQVDQLVRSFTPQVERAKRVEKQVEQTREQLFYSELGAAVPDWETINGDLRWLAWLKEYDVLAGRTRQDMLNDAAAAIDARRVVGIFKLFKSTLSALVQTPRASADLARQVAPSRSATAAVTPQGERTYSGQEYGYWTDHRRVHDTAKDKLEQMLAELERAFSEGRVKF